MHHYWRAFECHQVTFSLQPLAIEVHDLIFKVRLSECYYFCIFFRNVFTLKNRHWCAFASLQEAQSWRTLAKSLKSLAFICMQNSAFHSFFCNCSKTVKQKKTYFLTCIFTGRLAVELQRNLKSIILFFIFNVKC